MNAHLPTAGRASALDVLLKMIEDRLPLVIVECHHEEVRCRKSKLIPKRETGLRRFSENENVREQTLRDPLVVSLKSRLEIFLKTGWATCR